MHVAKIKVIFAWLDCLLKQAIRMRREDEKNKNKLKSESKWSARPAINDWAQQRGVTCTLITCLFALTDNSSLNSPEERAIKKGVFTGCQFGGNDPALWIRVLSKHKAVYWECISCTGNPHCTEGKKGHGVYHTSLHWWRQEDGVKTQSKKKRRRGIEGDRMRVGVENLFARWGAVAFWLKRPNVQYNRCLEKGNSFFR